MKIFIDTIKYKVNSIIKTQEFSNYLNKKGIENFDHEENKHKNPVYIYKRVSIKCKDSIKGSANYFTIFKTFYSEDKNNNKSTFFEFYGLKSYCKCIDDLRNNVIKLFHQWIFEKKLEDKASISSIDISFDFDNIHPFEITLTKNTVRGKQPKLNKPPISKTFFDTSTYYLYDKEFLEYKVLDDYSLEDLEKYYNDLFAYEIEDDYISYNIMSYEKELSHFNRMCKILLYDENSFGYKIGDNYYPISHYKIPKEKILKKTNKDTGEMPHDKLFANNKNIFFNIERYYKKGIYYKEDNHKNGIIKKLFIDSSEYIKKGPLYIFIQDLLVDKIIYPLKPKKDFQVILYDKKAKAHAKYNLETPITFENLSRVEFKINGISNLNTDIEKKIDLINILVNGIKQEVNFKDVEEIIKPYLINK